MLTLHGLQPQLSSQSRGRTRWLFTCGSSSRLKGSLSISSHLDEVSHWGSHQRNDYTSWETCSFAFLYRINWEDWYHTHVCASHEERPEDPSQMLSSRFELLPSSHRHNQLICGTHWSRLLLGGWATLCKALVVCVPFSALIVLLLAEQENCHAGMIKINLTLSKICQPKPPQLTLWGVFSFV